MAAVQWTIQETDEIKVSANPVEIPIVCPICWDHAVERIEGIVLSSRTVGGRDLSQVLIYRCTCWHVFALFSQHLT
jgi:hypothetical protein